MVLRGETSVGKVTFDVWPLPQPAVIKHLQVIGNDEWHDVMTKAFLMALPTFSGGVVSIPPTSFGRLFSIGKKSVLFSANIRIFLPISARKQNFLHFRG